MVIDLKMVLNSLIYIALIIIVIIVIVVLLKFLFNVLFIAPIGFENFGINNVFFSYASPESLVKTFIT